MNGMKVRSLFRKKGQRKKVYGRNDLHGACRGAAGDFAVEYEQSGKLALSGMTGNAEL